MGFVSIERSLFDHWIWKGHEPFDKRSAWVDLIGMAAYADHTGKDYQGNVIVIRRGEIHTSMLYLADRWKWDRRKVKRYLQRLAMDGMLSFNSTINGTKGGTTITLENYDFYQRKRTQDGTYDGTPDGTPDGTYHNKDNKDNNNINQSINNNNRLGQKKTGWEGKWTYADSDTGRIRFNIDQARKDRGV